MTPVLDINGQVFGRLTVLGHAGYARGRQRLWRCRCVCGKEVVVRGQNLKHSQTKSCGCLKAERMKEIHLKHGHARGKGQRTPEYRVWVGILTRCNNPKATSYPRYGGRWIRVCERWLTFENFLADMGPRPSPLHSLDRKDNDGPYSPENCRWATPVEQANNRRPPASRLSDQQLAEIVRLRSEGQTLAAIGARFGISISQAHRLSRKAAA